MRFRLEQLAESGVTTLRTDQQGAVRVVADGHERTQGSYE